MEMAGNEQVCSCLPQEYYYAVHVADNEQY